MFAQASLVSFASADGVYFAACSFDRNPDFIRVLLSSCNSFASASITDYVLTAVVAQRTGGERVYNETITAYLFNNHPWPMENDRSGWPPSAPNLNGNIMENYQSFSGAASAYWHQGLDVRSELWDRELGAEVHAPAAGTCVKVVRYSSSDLYWSVMVQDNQGFVWQFHHMDVDSITVSVGDDVARGQVLGRVAYWPSSHNGALYHHIHLNVVRPHPTWTQIPNPYVDGWFYVNPFRLFDLRGYTNSETPQSGDVMYFLENESNTAYASSQFGVPTLSGDIDIIVRWFSRYTPTNDIPGHPYDNSPMKIWYTITDSNNAVVMEDVLIDMNVLNIWPECQPELTEACSDDILRRVYQQSFVYNGQTFRSVFDYNTRSLYYRLTNTYRGQPDAQRGFWDSTQVKQESGLPRFPNGRYTVTAFAQDVFGKESSLAVEVNLAN
eukprot:TRINITY_DN4056_c0_g1_i2.p1 TRINITY_DN4056_c0_g1~~TRINITY_DN4056_c0_g1_i2.p1  ORF type:complete len:439 (-),score=96.92 TRINITY_DN4056_c0_g1_i2:89-1405(-)